MTNILLNAAFFLVRRLPKRLWVAIIGGLAFVASWLPTKELRKIMANYDRVKSQGTSNASFDFGAQSARAFARQVFFHQGLMVVETLRYSFDAKEVTIDGIEDYREALASCRSNEGATNPGDRGLIIATGHIGSWELLGAATVRAQNKSFAALAKAPDNPELQKALGDYRARLGVTSLWIEDDALVSKMMTILEERDALGMVIDQKPQSRRGYKVDFFGSPIKMVGGPILMGRKTGSPILGAYCLRVKPFHYTLCWEKLFDPTEEATNKELAQTLADSMARAITKAPSQWAWNYKRWV